MTTPSKAPQKTGGAKLAENQAQEVKDVIASDVTDAGLNKDLATAGVGDDATVIKLEDSVDRSAYEITDTAEFVTLQRDLVEEFYFPDTKRPSYRLLYTKGQVVSRAAIEAYNADVELANKRRENGGIDPANPAGIDSTTIASGTRVPALDSFPGVDDKASEQK
jgi:hypothetical protein